MSYKVSDGDPRDGGVAITAGFQDEPFRLRSYQAEMVEKSMVANIIVAMDTGSGKTYIALARTAAELERCEPYQMVWFIAPTVTLCEQQESVFRANLPAQGIKCLTGKDNVDHWSDQDTWDAVFNNVRIILSTHQVLLDALSNGFIQMQKLALIIFDEAHHCTKKHAYNLIMRDFYKPVVQGISMAKPPWILGLSASPVMKARASSNDLMTIEQNLHSSTVTPKMHRSELIRFAHKPELLKIKYPVATSSPSSSHIISSLNDVWKKYRLDDDPYVQGLIKRMQEGESVDHLYQKVITNGQTYCSQQLHRFVHKSNTMAEELGFSATEWYIFQCIAKYGAMVRSSEYQLLDWTHHELDYLWRLFQSNETLQKIIDSQGIIAQPNILDDISPKVHVLFEVLLAEAVYVDEDGHRQIRDDFTCLVFVEQRVWVAALAELLTTDSRTKNFFKLGTYVGTSQVSARKTNIADFAEPRNQQTTLTDFREGNKNLVLATSVLEEGIDIPSCHLVICFETPKNLKSFVQRRGRARKPSSKYIIFLPESGPAARSPEEWQQLERQMVQAYQDDLREIKQAEERELSDEVVEKYYKVPNTGALLTLENALTRLHHFCSLLGTGPFIDSRPQFSFKENKAGYISSTVLLPISVDLAFRTAESEGEYRTERVAKRDAAFQVYRMLHHAGLVNDHLLPSRAEAINLEAEFNIPDHTPSLVEVAPPFDPWVAVAQSQLQSPYEYHCMLLTLENSRGVPTHMQLLIPLSFPPIPHITLYWNESETYTVKSTWLRRIVVSEDELKILRVITRKIMYSIFRTRMQEERYEFLWLLVPIWGPDYNMDYSLIRKWEAKTNGSSLAIDLSQQHLPVSDWGLVNVEGDRHEYIVKAINEEIMESALTSKHGPQLQVLRAPKRRDFLHPLKDSSSDKAHTRTEWLNAADCVVSNLPATYSKFALFLPSILYKHEVFLLAETLQTTVLKPLSFDSTHLSLLVRALTSSATGEDDNYQRLEFLGDCILKFISSVHLMAVHIKWPESWLSGKKSKVVSNGFLARAAMTAGLDRFIITKRFTGLKWTPRYADDVLSPAVPNEKLMHSSKLLADVIESLIGASYVTGGFEKAFICVQSLLPLEEWTPVSLANSILFNAAPADIEAKHLPQLEHLVGHAFTRKALLLEALTHASYTGPNAHSSYERLEFLGDAVLDFIISKRLYFHDPSLSHQKMHAIRTSMVNAAFLSFRMFETTIKQTVSVNTTTMLSETKTIALADFIRHSSPSIAMFRQEALRQHQEAKEQIIRAVQHDKRFPWHLLALTDFPKFLSDIVESVIGAIYVDSHGSIAACESFVGKLGILEALERILHDEVDCLHPKERLGHLAVERSVQYTKLEAVEGSKLYRCQVSVGEENMGGPVEGLKRLQTETIAAWQAINIIEGKKNTERGVGTEEEWHDAEEGGGIDIIG